VETILTDTSQSALIAAIERNLFLVFDLFKQWPQAELHDTPELLWSITNIPYPLFNSVLRARLPSGTIDAVIDSTLAEYKSRNVPMMWWTGPSTQPSDLGTILTERGFHLSVNPGMAANLSSLPESYPLPKHLLIKRVENEEELDIWCRVVSDVFGNPDFVADAFFDLFLNLGFDSPFINYIGSIDNTVVATSSVFLGGGVAGIYDVATLESARRKGIGAAMTAIPLLEARSVGYRVSTLESSESGFNVYRKLGFKEYCKISRHIWMEDQ
jgi:ribosomal protein S18 acetylase RimI-like enzyme